jgi:triosephosphate isomerase (TIM)
MRIPLIAANWKMNKTIAETASFLGEFLPLVSGATHVDIVIAPPFTALDHAHSVLRDSRVGLAAQDLFYEDKGAYTGEISPPMLLDSGCSYVIVGHSERRQYFAENDQLLNRKTKAARKHGLSVIFCVGESLEEREAGMTLDIIRREIEEGLRDIPIKGISIAYEPIWAIGTGRTATPEQAQEVHAYIRLTLSRIYGEIADETRILYGGSVTPENVDALMACADVDGALVGGASLKADSFARIVNFKR